MWVFLCRLQYSWFMYIYICCKPETFCFSSLLGDFWFLWCHVIVTDFMWKRNVRFKCCLAFVFLISFFVFFKASICNKIWSNRCFFFWRLQIISLSLPSPSPFLSQVGVHALFCWEYDLQKDGKELNSWMHCAFLTCVLFSLAMRSYHYSGDNFIVFALCFARIESKYVLFGASGVHLWLQEPWHLSVGLFQTSLSSARNPGQ